MSSDTTAPRHRPSAFQACRHHLVAIVVLVVLGGVAGWLYAGSVHPTYSSTARVLVNPSVGNAYAPTPTSVRQDELTSLETEAQVAGSAEVLDPVAARGVLTTRQLEEGLEVTVPPNTQILEITFSSSDSTESQRVANAVADAYLANRQRRFTDVNSARLARVEAQTTSVVTDLRAATAAAQAGTPAERAFQAQLADTLRSELVSVRAQRTSLENTDAPPGAVIAPASSPTAAGRLTSRVLPALGALLGLALGCLLALVLERLRGVIRSAREVEAAGLVVAAVVPSSRWRPLPTRARDGDAFDTTIRRLRATLLEIEPRPAVIAVAPAGTGGSDASVTEALAESYAKAGHRVVLVRTDGPAPAGGLGVEGPGLAQALLHERLNALELLQPSVEPLLCLLPDGGPTAQSRELFVADRLRSVVAPLVEAGHLVIIQSPGIDSAEGEAVAGAADLGLVIVTAGRTRPREVDQVAARAGQRRTHVMALVVNSRDSARRTRRGRIATRGAADTEQGATVDGDDLARHP